MTWSERFTVAGVLSLTFASLLLVVALVFGVSALELILALVVLWVPLLAIAFTILGLALLGRAADRTGAPAQSGYPAYPYGRPR